MGVSAVLIANRGEVAVRVARAAAETGLRAVAVHTADEADAVHVERADEAVALPGTGAAAYLDADALVSAALATGCTLLHPGYGFLSESADLARRCAEAGLTFVGPSPETLELFGDKTRARALAAELGVPVLPGTHGPTSREEAHAFLAGLGPGGAVMVKALSGGGGRGTRPVGDPQALDTAWERCAAEARTATGEDALYVEELATGARHIEVQVLGDGTGAVSHLWERDCSVQRRRQKLVEIAPAPALAPGVRERLLDHALRMARAVRYAGVGTFEFLVRGERCHFLEANPRLQVEHTVTEEVTGVDLVATQLRLALGDSLPALGLDGPPPPPRGHALQARVNAETTQADGTVRPAGGRLTRFEPPSGPGIRVDTAVRTGSVIGTHYDPLLAKIVAHTPSGGLDALRTRALRALAECTVEGVATGIDLLTAVLNDPAFTAAQVTTHFVEDRLATWAPAEPPRAPDAGGRITAPTAATVVGVEVEVGQEVPAGHQLFVLEAMKMEHPVTAPAAAVVRAVCVRVGESVAEGRLLAELGFTGAESGAENAVAEVDLDAVRPDLAEVFERHAAGLDARRGEAVERRHRAGRRTARENLADLCDEGSYTEYGALAVAAQRRRRPLAELRRDTPADGMVTGTGRVGGRPVVAMSYDYTVLAGTQGLNNHRKTDRMLHLAAERRLPVVLFAEGGGGRPGDTDTTSVAGLDVTTFRSMARLSGRVPLVGIASGRCFAGNAALLGCCDVVIATPEATIGMGGPAMIEGGGLGSYRPEEVGPLSVQVPNGVVDVAVPDEAAAVATARRYLGYFQGPQADWQAPDPRRLRHVVPENRRRAYDVRHAIEGIADTGSVLALRPEFGVGVHTALARIEGRPLGLIANNPGHLGGAVDRDAADKAARFLQLCDAFGLPVLSLCDTPGFMVGPDSERTATVRHFSRLFVAGAHLRVPLVALVLRKAYGLGAMAMMGGSTRAPLATGAWPTGEFGGMGLEGAVRLGYRKELAAVADPVERERLFAAKVAELHEQGKAVNAAAALEIDAVIDPADSRAFVLAALDGHAQAEAPEPGRRGFVDTW